MRVNHASADVNRDRDCIEDLAGSSTEADESAQPSLNLDSELGLGLSLDSASTSARGMCSVPVAGEGGAGFQFSVLFSFVFWSSSWAH